MRGPNRTPKPADRASEETNGHRAGLPVPEPGAVLPRTAQTRYCPSHSGMIDGGRIMYMMKFNQSEQETKEEPELT